MDVVDGDVGMCIIRMVVMIVCSIGIDHGKY